MARTFNKKTATPILDRVKSAVRSPWRVDAWKNVMTGLGSFKSDKFEGMQDDGVIRRLEPMIVESIFHNDWIANRVCTAPPQKMFSKSFDVTTDDQKTTSTILQRAKDLQIEQKMISALTFENVAGGAAIFLGVDDGRPVDEPLDMQAIREVKFLTVFTAFELTAAEWQDNPNLGGYREPTHYWLTGANKSWSRDEEEMLKTGSKIHRSRLILLEGLPVMHHTRRLYQGWGQSKIDLMYDALRTYASNNAAIRTLIQEASQGVFKIQGLVDIMSGDGAEAFEKRMHAMQLVRSIARALILDADGESFERVETSFTSLPELMDRTAQLVAGAANFPVTVLFGREPSGMNASGESDFRGWYDSLESERNKRVVPALTMLFEILYFVERGHYSDQIKITFPELWTPTPQETAQLRQTNAATDAIYISNNVLAAEEIAVARFRPEGYQNEIVLTNYEEKAEDLEELSTDPGGVEGLEMVGGATTFDPTNLIAVVEKVNAGTLKVEQARVILTLTFPSLELQQINALLPDVENGDTEQAA